MQYMHIRRHLKEITKNVYHALKFRLLKYVGNSACSKEQLTLFFSNGFLIYVGDAVRSVI